MIELRSAIDDRLDLRWREIERQTQDAVLQKLGDRDLAANYALMLNDLRHDRIVGDATILGFRRAPGSKNRHHDSEGGLIRHLLQMASAWRSMREHIFNNVAPHPLLTDSNVWLAILHHDLNKIWRYRLVSQNPWTVEYYDTSRSKLLGGSQTALSFLMQYGITLSPLLHSALITAEGGYSDLHPKAESVFAKIVYLCDEMSANVIDRLRNNRFWDSLATELRDADEI